MCVCHYCELLTYDAAATLSTTSILNANLSTNDTSKLSAAASGNISVPTNSNTTTELISKQNPKTEIDPTKLKIINGKSRQQNSGTGYTQNPNSQNYLSLLVTPENAQPNNLEPNQHPTLTSNILPVTITENESLDAIFLFEFEEPLTTPLFSGAILKKKPITVMYTNVKVNGHFIKLILDIDCTASARIITADKATKTSISEINDFPFEVNDIIIFIKVLVMEATQYQALVKNDWLFKINAILDWTMQKLQLSQNGQHTCVPTTCGHFKTTNLTTLLIEFEKKEKKPTWKAYQVSWAEADHNKLRDKGKRKKKDTIQANNTYIPVTYAPLQQSTYCQSKLICIYCGKKLSSMGACCGDNEEYTSATKFYCCPCNNEPCLACGETLLNKEIWNNISGQGETCDKSTSHKSSRFRTILRTLPRASTYQGRTKAAFEAIEYSCNLIYNLPSCMIYTIPEEEPISSCALELESVFNPNLNSNNDDNENTDSSSVQYNNKNINNSDSNSNPKIYIALPDLSKKQELKWYSDNNEGIMLECAHNTNVEFDLRYLEKEAIKLKPNSRTCIDLKIALKILATIMVQLTSRSSLVKKEINIKREIIDTGYIRNIIAILQNDSEKIYIIEPNEKITQAIFLLLVKVAKLVLVKNREELKITARGIQGFEFMGRIDILINMAEEEIVDKGEIILIHQTISILSYDQYMLAIKREVRDQA
ncbi:hypothetical protein G9A89_013801 [Geosiphon pyriformis]|nr:hypothetical protein G9A89_013801 [Geosiphon pyriformis]